MGDAVHLPLRRLGADGPDPGRLRGLREVNKEINLGPGSRRYRDLPDDRGGTCTVTRLGPKSRTYEGSFTPPGQGNYALSAEVVAPSGEIVRPEVQFRVRPGNLERAARSADHESLILLAEQTGGRALTPDRLAELAEVIPDRSVRIPDDVAEPIWDTRLFLALLVLILSIEWGLRKWFGLI